MKHKQYIFSTSELLLLSHVIQIQGLIFNYPCHFSYPRSSISFLDWEVKTCFSAFSMGNVRKFNLLLTKATSCILELLPKEGRNFRQTVQVLRAPICNCTPIFTPYEGRG